MGSEGCPMPATPHSTLTITLPPSDQQPARWTQKMRRRRGGQSFASVAEWKFELAAFHPESPACLLTTAAIRCEPAATNLHPHKAQELAALHDAWARRCGVVPWTGIAPKR